MSLMFTGEWLVPWVLDVAMDAKLVCVIKLQLMLSKGTLDLLTQHLCVERWGHGVLYDAGLLPPCLTGYTQHNVLHLNLKNHLSRLTKQTRIITHHKIQ